MKKILYFIPAIVLCVFYGILGFIFELEPIAYLFMALPILSGILMCKNQWWGAIPGAIMGAWLMYLDLNATGQAIIQWPIGLVVFIYFVTCGIVLIKRKGKSDIEK